MATVNSNAIDSLGSLTNQVIHKDRLYANTSTEYLSLKDESVIRDKLSYYDVYQTLNTMYKTVSPREWLFMFTPEHVATDLVVDIDSSVFTTQDSGIYTGADRDELTTLSTIAVISYTTRIKYGVEYTHMIHQGVMHSHINTHSHGVSNIKYVSSTSHSHKYTAYEQHDASIGSSGMNNYRILSKLDTDTQLENVTTNITSPFTIDTKKENLLMPEYYPDADYTAIATTIPVTEELGDTTINYQCKTINCHIQVRNITNYIKVD